MINIIFYCKHMERDRDGERERERHWKPRTYFDHDFIRRLGKCAITKLEIQHNIVASPLEYFRRVEGFASRIGIAEVRLYVFDTLAVSLLECFASSRLNVTQEDIVLRHDEEPVADADMPRSPNAVGIPSEE